jgi:hypothetical protein
MTTRTTISISGSTRGRAECRQVAGSGPVASGAALRAAGQAGVSIALAVLGIVNPLLVRVVGTDTADRA